MFRKLYKSNIRIKNKNEDIVSNNIEENIKKLEIIFQNNNNFIVRKLKCGKKKAVLFFIKGIVDSDTITEHIIKPLMYYNNHHNNTISSINDFKENIIPISDIELTDNLSKVLTAILDGQTAVFVEGFPQFLIVNTTKLKGRSVSESTVEQSISGPRDAFSENIEVNISLVSRRLKNPDLKIHSLSVGEKTNTQVAIVYINGLAQESILKELMEKINKIKIDKVMDGGELRQFLEDRRYSLFPTIKMTERPDKVAADILEGRIAIIVDGSPFACILPVLLVELMQVADDYYNRPYLQSFLRLLRWAALFVALLAPGIYVAITTHHQEMIPISMLIKIADTKKGIPFPSAVEALLMELTFEVLREAGVRLPKLIGQAVSIVGALILGQAAVSAGFVTSTMVVVVSATAICSFVIPNYEFAAAIRLLRFAFLILGSIAGLYGLSLGFCILLIHLVSIKSFGIAYMFPLAPFNWEGFKLEVQLKQ